jgi:5-methylcytosine-specific restriction endonuclease McrA
MQHVTLVLNASYEPLGVVPWDVAITGLHNNKMTVVEEYEQVARSAYLTMRIPAVVRLNTYVSKPVKSLKFSRVNVYARDGYRCQYCGDKCKSDELTYDHVIPRSQGGTTVWDNIVSCCYDCNSKKGGRTPKQAKMKLLSTPVRPRSVPKVEFEFTGKSIPEQWRDYVYWNEELEE